MYSKTFAGLTAVFLLFGTAACRLFKQNTDSISASGVSYQKKILRISQFKTELLADYKIIDFKERALQYDRLVYNAELGGTYLPLIWEDKSNRSYGISAYVGDKRYGRSNTQEAVTCISGVLSAALLGIDKTNQAGRNYVDGLHIFFNEKEGTVNNTPQGLSASTSMWYVLYPTILFVQTSFEYPDETILRKNALTSIESWYKAYQIMAAENSFDYTGFDFVKMKPYKNNVWTEPDCAVGISLLMYYGYKLTGKDTYREAALNSLEYIDTVYFGSSMYEILLYYGPYLAALYNQEFGTDFNVQKMFDSIFNGTSIPRGGWGMLNDSFDNREVSGLMGSITDGGGYAFSMNTYAAPYIAAKTVKYDTRYAASIGKWLNHLISNARFFFADYADDDKESLYHGTHAVQAREFNAFAADIVPYEGIRKSGNAKSPWFGGDPTVYDWAETDFSLYSGSALGMLGVLYEKTDVDGILKIDLNAGDYFNRDIPAYLLYNPHETAQKVGYEVRGAAVDLYDAVTQKIIAHNVSAKTLVEIDAKDALVIRELSTGTELTREGRLTKAGAVILSSSQAALNVVNLKNNDEVKKNFTLKVETRISGVEDRAEYYEVEIDGKTSRYTDETIKIRAESSGTKLISVRVYTAGGLTDAVKLRLKIL